MARKAVETYPPFSRNDFLFGGDYGRDRLFWARSGLAWLSRYLALSSDSRTILRRKTVIASESRSGQIIDDFVSENVSSQPLTRREDESLRPLYFSWNISCLAVILGEFS